MSDPVRHVTDDERRARLARRHALAPGHHAADAEGATRAVVVLHSTEPASVHLAARARVPGLTRDDVDRAIHDERTLVKQLAMRRTLFVFPRDLLPATWASAAARTASSERARLAKQLQAEITDDGHAWMASTAEAVLAALDAAPDGLTTTELRSAVPALDVRVDLPSSQIHPGRLLTVLGAEATLVRGTNTLHWRAFRPRWQATHHWLGPQDEPWPTPAEGYAELVRRWLERFGPGTETDLVWWLGATKGAVRAALASLGAVPVGLDGGATGYLLPDDLVEVEPVDEPWAALLPVLDPTVMGWKERDFYLGPHAADLFDRNGNAGTTAWLDGRVVGCWVQDDDAQVHLHLLEDVGPAGSAALAAQAERLTAWLAGERVSTVYPSPAMKAARTILEESRP